MIRLTSDCVEVSRRNDLWVLPGRLIAHHGVKDDKEFMSDGDKGHLGWFSSGTKSEIEVFKDRIETSGVHGTEEERSSNGCSTGTDGSFAELLTAVSRDGSKADESGNLFA